jgi:hypothetical protein
METEISLIAARLTPGIKKLVAALRITAARSMWTIERNEAGRNMVDSLLKGGGKLWSESDAVVSRLHRPLETQVETILKDRWPFFRPITVPDNA